MFLGNRDISCCILHTRMDHNCHNYISVFRDISYTHGNVFKCILMWTLTSACSCKTNVRLQTNGKLSTFNTAKLQLQMPFYIQFQSLRRPYRPWTNSLIWPFKIWYTLSGRRVPVTVRKRMWKWIGYRDTAIVCPWRSLTSHLSPSVHWDLSTIDLHNASHKWPKLRKEEKWWKDALGLLKK